MDQQFSPDSELSSTKRDPERPPTALSSHAIADRTAAALVEFVGNLGELTESTWETLTGSRPAMSGGAFRDIATLALRGDPDIRFDAVLEELDTLRRYVAALVAALSHASHELAVNYLKRFGPDEIEAAVKMQGKRMFQSLEQACWAKYVELCGSLDADGAAREIQQILGRHVIALATMNE